jgi:CDP-glucose 4,6-dehydratase
VEFREGSLENLEMSPEFWRSRRVFLTGHTGFKGTWLSLWLQNLGAEVLGYSLPPDTQPNLFELAGVGARMESVFADIRDLDHLRRALRQHEPEIVFHLAAQALVRRSYEDPVNTISTNVMGTTHILEGARDVPSVRCAVIVTSDKCYENAEDQRAHRETDRLGGADPYSSSKAAAELVIGAYRKSFFTGRGGTARGVASARAGNVIGGGDWAADRLIPDVMRATLGGKPLSIRNPQAIRPWQHVLDPLCGYLTLAEKLHAAPERFSESWNFGPELSEGVTVLAVLKRLRELWGPDLSWEFDEGPNPREAASLKLDCAKARALLGWEPLWDLERSLEATVEWYRAYQSHQDVRSKALEQIRAYESRGRRPEVPAR